MTRSRLRYVLAGACALLCALFCALYGEHVRSEAELARAEVLERYGGEVVQLVVASEALEAGDSVDRQNVTVRDWLVDLAPDEAVTSLDEVLGLVVTVPVAAGVPLTATNFRDSEEVVDVPSGHVAISLSVTDKLGLPSSATVGTSLVAYEVTDSGAKIVTSDLEVLSLPGETTLSSSSGSLTLAVLPEDVSAVLSASASGTLRLALPASDVEGLEPQEEAPSVVEPEDSAAGGVGDVEGGDAA